METEDLMEVSEKSHNGFDRRIGITMAVFAAFLAVDTLMAHRLHTEEVVLQTKLADQWAYYQAKNTRAQMYATDAELARLQGPSAARLAADWTDKAGQERRQADDIRHGNEELEHDTQLAAHRAAFCDGGEVFLEIAIVLCSIALLTGATRFWQLAFASAAIGLVTATVGLLGR